MPNFPGWYLFIWTLADGRGEYYGSNAGFSLPDGSLRSADAAWISFEKLNSLPPDRRKRYFQVCPEFVIEVRSDTDRLPPLREKMELWIASGATLAWLIDPERRVVEIYRPARNRSCIMIQPACRGVGRCEGLSW